MRFFGELTYAHVVLKGRSTRSFCVGGRSTLPFPRYRNPQPTVVTMRFRQSKHNACRSRHVLYVSLGPRPRPIRSSAFIIGEEANEILLLGTFVYGSHAKRLADATTLDTARCTNVFDIAGNYRHLSCDALLTTVCRYALEANVQ